MRHTILALLVLLSLPSGGCEFLTAAAKILPHVIAGISEAEAVIDQIERFTDAGFEAVPNAELQRGVEQAIERCRLALQVALRSSAGAENLTQAQADAALADFRLAYAELLRLVAPLGVREQKPGEPRMMAAPGMLAVPPLLAMEPTS